MSEGPLGAPDPDQPQSGLRNPGAAVRGVGAATLAAEGLVLLLAIVPLRVLGASGTGGTLIVVILAMVSFALAGLLRRGWAWIGGSVLQVVVFGTGFLVHGSLAVLGVVFGLVWLYVLRVRRTVLGNQRR
jgi:Protein of unknown function (DUF4233)